MRPLACWMGRHEWTSRVEPGVTYEVCARCGKEPRRRRGMTGEEQQDSAYAGGPGNAGGTGQAGP